jgi:hypothetical protein
MHRRVSHMLIHVLTLQLIHNVCISHHQKRNYRESPPERTELTKLTRILTEIRGSISADSLIALFPERIRGIKREISVLGQNVC